MSAAIASAPILPGAAGGTGLVLPREGEPLRKLHILRRAEAWRLLRAHAAAGDLRAARRLAELARSEPELAVELLMDPACAVLARCERHREAALAWTAALARRREIASALEPRAHRMLRPGIHLALADANPLAMHEAHPDKQGNALSLGGRDEGEWIAALDRALAIVERHLPALIEEMRALALLVIPVGWEPEKHLSASYREYIGACYLTLHPDERTLAEALVHEFQHNKANLASYHDPLLENAHGTLVRSPVRPDPRPLWGVLLAVHAFVPVAELYARMLPTDPKVRERLAEVIAKNHEGLATLREHARPTRIGAALLEELELLHARHIALDLARPEGVAWEG